jgi:hypothetical protein
MTREVEMAVGFQVTFDAADPAALGRFWAEALGYEEDKPPEGFANWEDWLRKSGIPEEHWNDAYALSDSDGAGPRIFIQKVSEPKTAKNRVHLDLNVGGGLSRPIEERREKVDSEADRLTTLGASRLRAAEERGEYWIVMQDPEGNEFCLQ